MHGCFGFLCHYLDLYVGTNSEDAIQAVSTGELDPDETMAYVTLTPHVEAKVM
jgi:hypothetical protein